MPPGMLDLGLGFEANFFYLSLGLEGLGLEGCGLGLAYVATALSLCGRLVLVRKSAVYLIQ